MNRQYLGYIPKVGVPAANSHHGQQHQHKQPRCKAANRSSLVTQKLALLGRTM